MEEKTPILKVEDLNVKLDGQIILENINFSVAPGDVLAIVGPNGAGKSVLLRSLLKLIPHSGNIDWKEKIKINYIPQRFSVDRDFPLTVAEFFRFKSRDKKEIMRVLHLVGITDEHHLHHHILNQRLGWLSGGELQRALVAWAIIDKPNVLLFDEPTTGIDIGGEETIYNLIIMISHDLDVVYRYATNVLCLNKNMVCYGIPADALDPAALKKLYGEASFYPHNHPHK
jgi:zinc transport system ATP-binding protein